MALSGTRREAEFTAETVDKAIALGLRNLGVSREDVEIRVVQREQRKLGLFKTEAIVSIAYDEEYCRQKREAAEIEKYLTLRYAPDGFALKVDPVPEELHWQLLQVTTLFLIKHHVPNFRTVTREQLVEEQSGEYHVIFEPEVIELDGARASIYLSPTKMDAYYIQYDPAPVRRETLDEAIAHKGIVKGLIEEAIDSVTSGTHTVGLPIVIAQGKRPRNELASPLNYQFNPSKIRISFKEDSSVDFRDVMRLSFTKKDEVLVRKGERTPGEKGWTVTGEEINYRVESERPLPRGTNTYPTDDMKELRASIDGHIEVHDGAVCVEEVFIVKGDVDYHVGNITFDGSIIVGGDVLPGFEIKAKGNVEVFGSVDDAVIETDADLIVQYGIFARGAGRVTAKGDVRAWHAENIRIEARRIYIASSAVNCQLVASEIIEVTDDPGTLVAGVATAREYVYANNIGNEVGTRTEIIVGDTTEYDAQILALKRLIGEKARRRKDLVLRHEQAAATRMEIVSLPPGREQELAQMLKEAEEIDGELPELRAQLSAIKEERRRLATAKCHVFTKLYDGTHVRLFTARRTFTEDVEHSTLLFDKDRVRPFPFQYLDLDDESARPEGVPVGELAPLGDLPPGQPATASS
jgi:uncharacterized protein (DUF342 family)